MIPAAVRTEFLDYDQGESAGRGQTARNQRRSHHAHWTHGFLLLIRDAISCEDGPPSLLGLSLLADARVHRGPALVHARFVIVGNEAQRRMPERDQGSTIDLG